MARRPRSASGGETIISRRQTPEEETMQVRPLSPHVGAEIGGVDVAADLPDDVFQEIDDAYNRYSVLVFRDQKLTPEQQIAFARRFGDLEISPRTQFALPGHPEILVLSNLIENGRPLCNADAGAPGTPTCPTPRRRRAAPCCMPARSRWRTAARSAIRYS